MLPPCDLSPFFCSFFFFFKSPPLSIMDYSLPDLSVRGIFQARALKWVAISFSRESS